MGQDHKDHFDSAEVGEKSIWRVSGTECAIGVVVLAVIDDLVAIVRKAPVPGYEFSDQWAFPGGLVRDTASLSFSEALEASARRRAFEEANIQFESLEVISGNWGLEYPVTSYSVRGELKYTAVVPVIAELKEKPHLRSNHHSISEAQWGRLADLDEVDFAPANAVVAEQIANKSGRNGFKYRAPSTAIEFCKANAMKILRQPLTAA